MQNDDFEDIGQLILEYHSKLNNRLHNYFVLGRLVNLVTLHKIVFIEVRINKRMWSLITKLFNLEI